MSSTTQNRAKPREDERSADEQELEPACETLLSGNDSEWEERPAAVYPPEYPRLCPRCFSEHIPDEAWNGEGRADYDHSSITDTLLRSDTSSTGRMMHLPAHVDAEVDDAE